MENWIALSVSIVALFVSIFGTFFIVRWNKRTVTFNVFDVLYEKLNSPELPEELRLVGSKDLENINLEEYINKNAKMVYQVLNVLEQMSLKIIKKYIEEDIIKGFYRHLIVETYIRFNPMIEHIKKINPNNDCLYQHFAEIYKRWR